VIQELDNNNTEEIHDSIYEQLAAKLEDEKPEFSYKHFLLDEGEHEDDAITIKESNSFIRDGTTGLKLWPAAMALGEFIMQNKSQFDGKSIVELGSGATAFVGMILIKTCRPEKVILSDCHESVIQTLIENVSLNLSRYETEVMDKSFYVRQRLKKKDGPELGIVELPWEDVDKCADELVNLCQPNILLAADVVYDDTIFEALIKCINKLFELFGTSLIFYLSQTIRNVATFEKFCHLLHVNDFKISEESVEKPTISNVTLDEIKIIRISK
jgi:protein-lysine N-methyltransferase EEF2KMT